MEVHKYVCGQQVSFTDRRIVAPGLRSEFVIVKLLPIGDEAPRYEVQGAATTASPVWPKRQCSRLSPEPRRCR
jgi:hypothetical protein